MTKISQPKNVIKKIKKDNQKKAKQNRKNQNKTKHKQNIVKDIKIFLKIEKKKSNNMVVNVTKISQKMKNKSLLSIEKSIIEWEKTLHYNYKKLF